MAAAYLIGTDEAGYGPNLGPLVISASVWQVPGGARGDDLYRLLGSCVTPLPRRAAEGLAASLAIGDSKRLYQPGGGLGHLERGLLAALAVLDRHPRTWREVWAALSGESTDGPPTGPWYDGYDAPVPVDADSAQIRPLARTLRQALDASNAALLEVRSRAVFPEEFNRLVEHHGTKGAALSHSTLRLVAGLVESLPDGPVSIVCDKHGGRNRYGDLLMDHFPQYFIETGGESRASSVYRFGPPGQRVEIRFQTKGESHLPAALASMASKYLRELAMRAWNDFWCRRVEGLRPTAGYPQDAKRFKAEIAAVQSELGIDDRVIWRSR